VKASVLTAYGKVEYTDVPDPRIKDDEALIRVACSGICGTDVHVFQGHHPAGIPPVIMGHEFSGTIVEVAAENKKGLKEGDRVVVQPYLSCGICELCIAGRENCCADLKIFGIHVDGCFSQFVKAPLQRVYSLPESIDLKTASLIEPLAVAYHDVRSSGFAVGNSTLVIGGGPIGLLIAAVARTAGASEILVTELNPHRKALLSDLGFEVHDPTQCDITREIRKRTAGMGYDKVFEVSGTKSGTDLMIEGVKTGGTCVIVGIPTDKYPMDTATIFKREITIRGVRIHSQIHFRGAIQLASNPEIQQILQKLITREFPLPRLGDAINLSLTSSEISKIVITY